MSIVRCSLGCAASGTNPTTQMLCGETEVFVNQELTFEFSSPIKFSSVNTNSFQLVEIPSGRTPPGAFSISPTNPNLLIYRPQLTFDSAGNASFGLTLGATYAFKIPGAGTNDLGPFIRNLNDQDNANRLACTLVASQGVRDAVLGSPSVTITLDTVKSRDPNGDPIDFNVNVPARGAIDVYRNSPVRMVFNDIMNPSSLANPVTRTSESIAFFVDPDGDLTDPGDQVVLAGTFTLEINQAQALTTVIFQPSGGLPSAGHQTPGRRILVTFAPGIVDLGDHALINPGVVSFTPEVIDFDPIILTEAFDNNLNEDAVHSGATWGPGVLTVGRGGGSGRLGELIVPPGQVVELDTDLEDFSSITSPLIFNPSNVIDRPDPFQVLGGVFEFSRLRVDAGGVLRLRGSNPARILVRGTSDISGLVDIAGGDGLLHNSLDFPGGEGGVPGPNGGKGGNGGDRPDGSAFVTVGGAPNPSAGPSNVLVASTYVNVNGKAGGGIAFPSTIAPSPTFVGGGGGGLSWPQPTASTPTLHMPADLNDTSGLQLDPFHECSIVPPGAPGAGGAYALSGRNGVVVADTFSAVPFNLPPNALGGNSALLAIDEFVRSLSPELGLLRGGSGGGGGGGHLQFTRSNATPLSPCFTPPVGSTLQVGRYVAHSGAGGGGSGGALQVVGGRAIILRGVIDASGGNGGSGTFPLTSGSATFDLAQAGGAGSGGAVMLQSQTITIQPIPGRINVSGGVGGEGTGRSEPVVPSQGGLGGPGMVRLEANTAPSITSEETKVEPREADLQAIYGSGVAIEDIISTATWTTITDPPAGYSGAQSCWIRPDGSFFQLQFADDAAVPGWDMRLRITGQAEPQSYRGENVVFPGNTLEQIFGSDLGSAPVVVRFQGARANSVLLDPCSVPEAGASSPLAANSLTDWVLHPAELNDFFGADQSRIPNIFRFTIIWDPSQVTFSQIEGVEDITITMLPD